MKSKGQSGTCRGRKSSSGQRAWGSVQKKRESFPLSTLASKPKTTRGKAQRAPPDRQGQQVQTLNAQVQECKAGLAKCKEELKDSREDVDEQQELQGHNIQFIDRLQTKLDKMQELAKNAGANPKVIDDIKNDRDQPSTSGTH